MIEQKIRNISGTLSRSSIFLSRSLSENNRIERNLEKRSLILKRKIVEERGRTLRNLASTNRETQKGGVLGGALGLLGLGGGGLLRRGLKRTPSSPNQLLRMQKGTSNLSRVGKVGKIGRLAKPLAVVGTGLDFIGRRAEGQSNVQAGVGAAGGLAGSLAGAKIGATLGTALGPVGTLVGGAGGAIIGGLIGGNFADSITGANRRRQLEVERVAVRTQKTLFSEALDDFDKVLDKFENFSGEFVQRERDDELAIGAPERRFPFGSFFVPKPKPKKPFLQRPSVQITGVSLLTAGLVVLALATRGKSAPASQKILEKALVKSPLLKKLSEKEQIAAIGRIIMKGFPKSTQQKIRMSTADAINKRGTIVPGQKGAPGISKKGLEVRNLTKAERIELKAQRDKLKEIRLQKRLKKLEEGTISDADLKKLENDPSSKDIINEITRATGKDVTLDPSKITRETLTKVEAATAFLKRMDPSSKNASSFNRMLGIERSKLVDKIRTLRQLNEITPKESTKIRLKDAQRALKIIDDALTKFGPRTIQKKLFNKKGTFENLDMSSNNLEPPDSTNLALAPVGDIFLLGGNNNEQTTPQPVINVDGGSTVVLTNPYDAVAANLTFESSLTT
jgi:hypothetical protein